MVSSHGVVTLLRTPSASYCHLCCFIFGMVVVVVPSSWKQAQLKPDADAFIKVTCRCNRANPPGSEFAAQDENKLLAVLFVLLTIN